MGQQSPPPANLAGLLEKDLYPWFVGDDLALAAAAHEELHRRYQPYHKAIAGRATGHDTHRRDDILQQQKLKTWLSRQSFDPVCEWKPWSTRFLITEIANEYRRLDGPWGKKKLESGEEVRRKIPHKALADDHDGALSESPVDDEMIIAEYMSQMRRCWRRLQQQDRDLWVARHLDGQAIRELSETFGIPMGTLGNRLEAIRRKLHECMTQNFFEGDEL